MFLALAFGSIFPYFASNYLYRSSSHHLIIAIRTLLTTGFLSAILLSFLWNTSINGVSVPLYIIFFLLSSCGAISNVTHYMFVSKFDARKTTMLSTGMGLGSLIAGVLAISQGLSLNSYGYSLSW